MYVSHHSSAPCEPSSYSSIAERREPTLAVRSRAAIDAQAVARLKDRVTLLNQKAVDVSEAAIAAMEWLCCGNERAMELAIQRGTGQSSTFFGPDSRSIPELVREAIDRGAPSAMCSVSRPSC